MKSKLEIAKQIIKEEIEKADLRLISLKLFGSRARGDSNRNSDWDFYAVVNEDIDFARKLEITSQPRRRLIEYDFSCDIIIHSISLVNKMKNDIGYITYYVFKEGVEIL